MEDKVYSKKDLDIIKSRLVSIIPTGIVSTLDIIRAVNSFVNDDWSEYLKSSSDVPEPQNSEEISWRLKYEQMEAHYKILEWSYNGCLEELQKFKQKQHLVDIMNADQATGLYDNASNVEYIKELPEVAELDRVINTYVHGYGSEAYKHIQQEFWNALDAVEKQRRKQIELYENVLDKSTEHLMRTQEERNKFEELYLNSIK